MLKIGIEFCGDLIDAGLFFRKMQNAMRLPYQAHSLGIEDLYGELAFSMFSVVVAGPHVGKLLGSAPSSESKLPEHLINFATSLLRKFVGIYRHETVKHWIALPLRSRMSPWNVIVRDERDIALLETIVDYRGTGVGAGTTLSDTQFAEIEKLCCATFDYDHAYQFMETANRLKITGDYQGAILYLAIYVETWLYREIRYSLVQRGKSPQQIEDFFKDGRRFKSITRVIKDFVGGGTHFRRLENTTEYSDYRKCVADRRNEVAHGTYLEITEIDAERAVKSAMAFRDHFLTSYIGPVKWTSKRKGT